MTSDIVSILKRLAETPGPPGQEQKVKEIIEDRLLGVATREGIRCQTDVLTSTYLDSSQVHLTAGGIPGGSICFSRRYSHSPVEMSHLNDLHHGLQLLVKFIESLEREPIHFARTF